MPSITRNEILSLLDKRVSAIVRSSMGSETVVGILKSKVPDPSILSSVIELADNIYLEKDGRRFSEENGLVVTSLRFVPDEEVKEDITFSGEEMELLKEILHTTVGCFSIPLVVEWCSGIIGPEKSVAFCAKIGLIAVE